MINFQTTPSNAVVNYIMLGKSLHSVF